MSSWLSFEDDGPSVSGLTRQWVVRARKGHHPVVGLVTWQAGWRRYCFSPMPEVVLDGDGLSRIAEFCEEQTRYRGKVGHYA